MSLLCRFKLGRCADVGDEVVVKGSVWVHGGGQVRVGRSVIIDGREAPVEFNAHPGAEIMLGRAVRVGPGASLEATAAITIGDEVELGPFCKILDSNMHSMFGNRTGLVTSEPVHVESGAVIGERAILLPGARIRAGSRVAARAVVGRRGWPAPIDRSLRSPRQGAMAERLNLYLCRLVWMARACVLFGFPAAGRRIYAKGRVLVRSRGTLTLGRGVVFVKGAIPTEIRVHPGASLVIGEHSVFNGGSLIEAGRSIEVGRRCMFGSGVCIRDREGDAARAIVLEDDVWVAHGVTVLPGVRIGARSVLSAGSIIGKDVPADCLAMGNPARSFPMEGLSRLCKRFEADEAGSLAT